MNPKRTLFGTVAILALILAACGPGAADLTATAGGQVDTTDTFETPRVTSEATSEGTPSLTRTIEMTTESTTAATEDTSGKTPTAAGTAGPAGTETPSTQAEPVLIRASDLIGLPIVGEADAETEIGTVDEVLVDQEGTVQFVVFDSDRMPGAGSQMVAVPFDMFAIEPADEQLTFMGAEADLQAATRVDTTVIGDDDFLVGEPDASTPAPSEFKDLIRVSRFSDFDLRNSEDEDLGEVEDLVINLRQGAVEDTVVNFGGFLGIGEKSVAIPWAGLQLSTDPDNQEPFFLLDVQAEQLERAPAIEDMDQTLPRWPEAIDPEWDREHDSFWQTLGI